MSWKNRARQWGLKGYGFLVSTAAAAAAIFYFDASEITFTPKMAKRAAPGPFAAAPIVQGDWTLTDGDSDTVTLPRGSQISGNWYDNFDPYQGFIQLWYTPEHDGDSKEHYLMQWSANGWLKINTSNQLELSVASGVSTTATITLTAGTKVHLFARYDSKNDIDGTNYLCLSVNDTHTFGRTSSYTSEAPSATIYVGSDSSGENPANGIIEGLTWGRFVPWDGAYGVDNGDGDVINLAYAAGSGKDVTEVRGSWDSSCLPTNATAGELTTGSTDAWSHPHSSAVLTDSFCQTAYTGSAWGDKDTVITPKSLEFNGTSTSINCGSDASLDNLPNGDFTAELWFHYLKAGSNMLLSKYGVGSWWMRMYSGIYIDTMIYCGSGSSARYYDALPTELRGTNKWIHVALTWDFSTKTTQVFVNGVLSGGGTSTDWPGYDDSANGLSIGAYNSFDGSIAWVRISDNIRYSTNFTPPSRTKPPATDGNTVEQWNLDDGAGTVAAAEVLGANDGTITDGTWNVVKDLATDAPGERVYNWGYVFGASANDDGIEQSHVGLTPGDKYIARLVAHTDVASSSNDEITLYIYDDTNSAVILDYDFGGSSDSDNPEVALQTFTLPALCTAMTVKVLANAAGATVYVHQLEVYPTDETFAAGDYAGINDTGTLVKAVLQVGSGTSVTGHQVARITDAAPTLFDPVKLDAISLTVTPSSESDASESTGLRVSGRSTATQTQYNGKALNATLTATAGSVAWEYTPRHDAGDVAKFGETTPYIAEFYGAADNWIRVYWSAANTITMAFNDGGGEHSDTWDATGVIDAGTTYEIGVEYTAAAMLLTVGGVTKITITTAINFATVPATAYWGSKQDGTQIVDATFGEAIP